MSTNPNPWKGLTATLRRTCTKCDQRREIAGSTMRNGHFVCAQCRLSDALEPVADNVPTVFAQTVKNGATAGVTSGERFVGDSFMYSAAPVATVTEDLCVVEFDGINAGSRDGLKVMRGKTTLCGASLLYLDWLASKNPTPDVDWMLAILLGEWRTRFVARDLEHRQRIAQRSRVDVVD